MKLHHRLGLLGATMLAGAVSVSTNALAQDAPAAEAESEEIVVTGSRIRRSDLSSAAPIQILSAETIDNTGITNIADALNAIPGAGIPVNPIGDQATFATGRNFINIFNLGSQRTLTLVNGRRFVSANPTQVVGGLAAQGQQVDLNAIPTALIDRIETIQAGGAAVYGSDAIAGVINVILREDFEGFELDAQYGNSQENDFRNERLRAAWGANFLEDRGNVAISAEYNSTDGLLNSERPGLTGAQRFFAANPANTSPTDGIPGAILIENRRVPELTQGGLAYITNSTAFSQIVTMPDPNNPGQRIAAQFGPDGDLIPYNRGQFFQTSIASGGDGLNLGEIGALASPVERLLLTGLGHFDLTDNLRISAEVFWNRVESTETANQPIFNATGIFAAPSNSVTLSVDNPFLTDQARQILLTQPGGPLTNLFLARASSDLLGGTNSVQSQGDTYRVVLDLEGEFALGDHDFFWNVAGNLGRADGFFSQPSVVQARWVNAINAVRAPSGDIVCAVTLANPGSTNADISECQPLNLFGVGAPSQAAIDYLITDFRADFENEQKSWEANFGGDIVRLPGGWLSFVAGYEYREESGDFKPNDAFRLGIGRGAAIAPVRGSFDTSEFYIEGLAPVFGDDFQLPLFYSLEFEGAYRTVDNAQFGKEEAWTYGGRWRPYRDLTLRGTMSRTFRAPALAELFLPQVTAFSTAVDPCDARNINTGPSPATRRANCEATFLDLGLPANFQLTSNVQSFTIQIITGGNPNLLPEIAEAWSAGLVFQPSWAPGLIISGDWVNIDLANSIENFNLTATLQTCYDTPNLASPFCANFTRNAQAQVTAATTGRVNAGFRSFQGLTASIELTTDLSDWLAFRNVSSPGRLIFDFDLFHVNRLETSVNGTGSDLNDDKDEIGNSDLEWNFRTTYENGPFRLNWLTRYIGDAKFNNAFTRETQDILEVDAYFLNDASIIYDFTENLSGRIVVNNIWDVEPPFAASTSANGIPTYDHIGRYFFIGATAKF